MNVPFFDLASLAKPLVTAPLVLRHLDLDADRRFQLGFDRRPTPLTVRQLLSHRSGLPPWLPYTGEPLAHQLERTIPFGKHPLLREGREGWSVYSDLGYRLLAELLERVTGQDWYTLGAEATGLFPAPWSQAAQSMPEGPDAEAWAWAAPDRPYPPPDPHVPHDINARAGMKGHAGFGADPETLRRALQRWIDEGHPERMASEQGRAPDGTVWGLGLQRAFEGPGRFGQWLARIPPDVQGIHVLTSLEEHRPEPLPPQDPDPGAPTTFWMHFAFTGPALFVRPEDGLCIAILVHRRGPDGELLSLEELRARRWHLLRRFVIERTEGGATLDPCVS